MREAIIRAGAVLALTATAALAGIGNSCEVKETPDGFVAVRAQPSAKGALVAKARPGQMVEIVTMRNGQPRSSGDWVRVRHYPGETIPDKGEPGFKDVREGWMYRRLIDGCG